jgi:predicted kinase
MQRALLCLISGIPLSGKSSFIGQLMKRVNDYVFISTDEIRFDRQKNYRLMPENEPLVWKEAYAKIDQALKEKKVIFFDDTLLKIESRGVMLTRYHHIPVILFAFEKPSWDTLAQRNQRRNWKKVDEETLKNYFYSYQFPTDNEKKYYYRVFEVKDGQDSDIINDVSELLNELHG